MITFNIVLIQSSNILAYINYIDVGYINLKFFKYTLFSSSKLGTVSKYAILNPTCSIMWETMHLKKKMVLKFRCGNEKQKTDDVYKKTDNL